MRKLPTKVSQREAFKSEQEVHVLADELKGQGSVDENARASTIRGLKPIRKIREEAEAAKELLEFFRTRRGNKKTRCGKNSKNLLPRATQRRDGRVLEARRSGNWHIVVRQKSENLDNDFTEATSRPKKWAGRRPKRPKCWLEQNDGIDSSRRPSAHSTCSAQTEDRQVV